MRVFICYCLSTIVVQRIRIQDFSVERNDMHMKNANIKGMCYLIYLYMYIPVKSPGGCHCREWRAFALRMYDGLRWGFYNVGYIYENDAEQIHHHPPNISDSSWSSVDNWTWYMLICEFRWVSIFTLIVTPSHVHNHIGISIYLRISFTVFILILQYLYKWWKLKKFLCKCSKIVVKSLLAFQGPSKVL